MKTVNIGIIDPNTIASDIGINLLAIKKQPVPIAPSIP